MKDFNIRIFSSLPIIFLASISLYLKSYYLLFFISLIYFVIIYEWNYFFFKKNNYYIFLHLIIYLLIFISFYQNIYIFLFLNFLNFIFLLFNFLKNKLHYLYIVTNLYFYLSLYSILNILNINYYGLLLFIIFTVVIFDISSYIFGNIFKGKKLIPKISPNKTLSGFLLGIIFTFIISSFLNKTFGLLNNDYQYSLLILIIFSAIIGDIIESIIKRKLSLKDISNLLPGHGGFFDRFDSLLFVFIIINFTFSFIKN
tara:strand:+ start:749 stop:1516 length:768 start_codon:yes stop_codon:yes gene_type:complete